MDRDPSALSVGDTLPKIVVEDLERRDFVKYAGASGDFTRLHYDDTFAESAGHPSVFGQGMFVASVASRVFTQWLGVESVESFNVRFNAPVWPEESILASASVAEKHSIETGVRLDFDLVAETQEGKTLLMGEAQVRVPAEEQSK